MIPRQYRDRKTKKLPADTGRKSFDLVYNGNPSNDLTIPILWVDEGKSEYFGLRQSFLKYYNKQEE